MRKLILLLAFALAFGAASVAGQNSISIDAVSNTFPTGGAGSVTDVLLAAGQSHQIDIVFNVIDLGSGLGYLTSNSWDMWGTANWGIVQGSKGPVTTSSLEGGTLSFLVVVYNNHFLKTGNTGNYGAPYDGGPAAHPALNNSNVGGMDTAGFQLVISNTPGLWPGSNGLAYTVSFRSDVLDHGETICFGRGQKGAWEWAQLAGQTDAGPIWHNGISNHDSRCWTVSLTAPPQPPCFGVDAVNYSFSHCDAASVSEVAADPEAQGITYSLVSGPGAVDANTGEWTWSGPSVPQSGNDVVVIRATDDYSGPGGSMNSSTCYNGDLQIYVTITNEGPAIECPGSPVNTTYGIMTTQTVAASDPDPCDGVTVEVLPGPGYSVANTNVVVNGDGTFDIEFTPSPPARIVEMEVMVSDGDMIAGCALYWNLIEVGECCAGRVGDANNSGWDEPTIGDVGMLIDHLFINKPGLFCVAEGDINQSGGTDPSQEQPGSDITVGDVADLIDYLFITGPVLGVLPDCL